jgi:hypothetical protein
MSRDFAARVSESGWPGLSWGVIATDQALHLSILAVSFYWLAR